MNPEITLGADPELAILDESKGLFVSALNVLQKDKHDPIPLVNGIKIYADNALMEASMPPSAGIKGMMMTMRDALLQMQEYLGTNFRIVPKSAVSFTAKELMDKRCWEVGCNPNVNGYTGLHNPIPKFTNGTRTGSFHIHIGHPNMKKMTQKMQAVQLLDIYLGCGSILFDHDDSIITRRELYGRAGEFRPTPYGIEYRVLGNGPLHNPEVTRLCLDLVDFAMTAYDAGVAEHVFADLDMSDVRAAINECNSALASEVLYQAGLEHNLFKRIKKDYGYGKMYESWLNYEVK